MGAWNGWLQKAGLMKKQGAQMAIVRRSEVAAENMESVLRHRKGYRMLRHLCNDFIRLQLSRAQRFSC